ncbi:MAG: guanylate kinase [Arsenophonus endosymbiont of Ceratovacuna japonica]
MIKGKLYIISAPSGTGKSTLIKALLKIKSLCNMKVSISYTTRAIRPGEKNNKHYYFISKYKFKKMIKNNDFLEYACVFGNYYGTSRIIIEKNINSGINMLLNIDWQGAKQIRQKITSICTIFILPPSKNELLRRLRMRNQDSEEIINKRIKQSVNEIKHYHEYDYIIINNNFNVALEDLKSIIQTEYLNLDHKSQKYNILINKLLVE